METATAFATLNDRQREAACFGGRGADGAFRAAPLLVVAGAGTGKTSTLAHRVAHLVLEGVAPERILLLTFTRRAAEEMTRRARRIVAQVRREARFAWAGTFHSVANRLIRRHAARVGLEPSFSVLDRGDAADLMDVLRHELAFAKPDGPARRFPRKDTCLAIYSHRINTQGALAATLAAEFPWCAEWEQELTRLYRAYVERKLAHQALDYDDLLLYWHAMMQDEPLAREIGGLFDQVLVDEYQDTNVLQAEILRRLRPDGAGVTVVGDDAQAIYAFRAATVENILGFPAQYAPPAQVITLEENYRSTQGVLDAANALIGEGARQYRKDLRAARGAGTRPRLVTVADELAQADYIAARVLEAREGGVMLRRQAALFRNAHHSGALELELARRNIPFVKYGGLKFLEAGHVKDLLSILRWADNPKNRVAAFRALQLQQGVGPGIAARIFTRFEAEGHAWLALQSRSEPFDALMAWLGDARTPWPGQAQRVREWLEPQLDRLYDAAPARAGDLHQLERIAAGFEARESFLTELALDPPAATGDRAGAPLLDEDYLVLSTVHSAKGQEWESVYLLNVADGSFPSEFATGRPDLIEEERRLLYVAMTRARSELHLVAPLRYYVTQQAKRGDAHVYGARSRFLTRKVIACLEEMTWPQREGDSPEAARGASPVDVAGRLRALWV
ncbi:MAG: ATP-dependent DNA helicase [Betaproteobacteria bacterium RIFCSPLOWO2_12_FULL_67_28]|nr:MAG: ATP-dependent DNA helicase [Betaproteobacteria bacterium RIFCSPLOWO2_02_FULL_68_150]OGA69428.1 MAG: ATP-dependent DNA helicase [Betaproteobacteria bacterium RIFCSPLOWO2_12_FULL_67_28]